MSTDAEVAAGAVHVIAMLVPLVVPLGLFIAWGVFVRLIRAAV